MHRSGGTSAVALAMASWMATPHATAATTLSNSTRAPSPISLTRRPSCVARSRVDDLGAVALERCQRARLVLTYEAAVANHVRGEDGEQATQRDLPDAMSPGDLARGKGPCQWSVSHQSNRRVKLRLRTFVLRRVKRRGERAATRPKRVDKPSAVVTRRDAGLLAVDQGT